MSEEEIEKQLKLSKRQSKDERYDYLCSEFNAINYCINLEKYTNKLQQENKKLNGAIQTYDILLKANVEENKQLKDNWNKLKEYIRKNIIYDDVGMKILDPSPLEDYMQELEQGSDSNE